MIFGNSTVFDEETIVLYVSWICNVLYGLLIVLGFWILPRERMLFITIATAYVGPALILIGIGGIFYCITCLALYPLTSISVIWIWFFLTSRLAQLIGLYYGLDSDNDGDVDLFDLLHYLATRTRIGQQLRLHKLHTYFNNRPKNPFDELHDKIDSLTHKINTLLATANTTTTTTTTTTNSKANLESD
jgi:hypothetical protein